MIYNVSWDGPSAQNPQRGSEVDVSTVAELDAVLDRVAAHAAAKGVPFAVQVDREDSAGSVMIGVGHPQRSFIDWLMDEGHRSFGSEPDMPAAAASVVFDVYGEWHEHPPEQSRVSPAVALEAAREYVRTGERPTCINWSTP